jgi:hypothetical protein
VAAIALPVKVFAVAVPSIIAICNGVWTVYAAQLHRELSKLEPITLMRILDGFLDLTDL